MALIDEIFSLCQKRLVGSGWDTLLKQVAGLKIKQSTAKKLAAELARSLPEIDRNVPGFEDFALDGQRGIEPATPAQSLFFHALASPNVLNDQNGSRLRYFPTPKELETVENYVFGVRPPTVAELIERGGTGEIALIVCAYEYRPAAQTSNRVHADMMYARTGIARVGTRAAHYRADLRGFYPELPAEPFGIAVSPARYGLFLAVRLKGSVKAGRPLRPQEGDERRLFWAPVHKLFSGKECLEGMNLKVAFSASHVNEKIFRLHKFIFKSTRTPKTYPYRITDTDIAEISNDPSLGAGLLVPKEHEQLIEEARVGRGKGKLLTFFVPATKDPTFSSLDLSNQSQAPSYVHIRTQVTAGRDQHDLNDLSERDLMKKTAAGGYRALHYVDFTGDGWVTASVRGLKGTDGLDRNVLPAYSLVSAPDFFPSCDQRELSEWTQTSLPASLQPSVGKEDDDSPIWNIAPDALCDMRHPANLQLDDSPFTADENTISALVPGLNASPPGTMPGNTPPAASRHSHLPDDAAGVFAPGWDVSVDELKVGGKRNSKKKKVEHLAAYPLGSPFPEDAKLCAALSTFWPAVAPDSTREMEPAWGNQSGTVAPLTDEEIGRVGDMPWDGISQWGRVPNSDFAEYASFQHADYVRSALQGKFTLRTTAQIDADEYERRVLAVAFAYLSLGAERRQRAMPIDPKTLRKERLHWKLLSFQTVAHGSPELEEAKTEAGLLLSGRVYRMEFFQPVPAKPKPPGAIETTPGGYPFALFAAGDERRKRLKILRSFRVFVAPDAREVALREAAADQWKMGIFRV
jgi:hypothetical protein